MATISDLKQAVDLEQDGVTDYFIATVKTQQDYYPFGMLMPGRSYTANSTEMYRYGFNGMEKNDEIEGVENSYTTLYRQNDPRLGRWFSIDPETQPWQSPFCSMDNNPIIFTDVLGDVIRASRQEKGELRKRKDWNQIKDKYQNKWFQDGKIFQKSEKDLNVEGHTINGNITNGIESAQIQDVTLNGSSSVERQDYLHYKIPNKTETKTFKFENVENLQYENTSSPKLTRIFPLSVGNDFHCISLLRKESINSYLKQQHGVLTYNISVDNIYVKPDDTNPTNPATYWFFLNSAPWNLGLSGPNGNRKPATFANPNFKPVIGTMLDTRDNISAAGIWNTINGHVDACRGFRIRATLTITKKAK